MAWIRLLSRALFPTQAYPATLIGLLLVGLSASGCASEPESEVKELEEGSVVEPSEVSDPEETSDGEPLPPLLAEGAELSVPPGAVFQQDLELAAGELFQLEIEQDGVDLVLRLWSPDGDLLAEIDSPTGSDGPEELLWITRDPGIYRVEVSAFAQPEEGSLTVQTLTRRTATETDRRMVDADRLFREGRRLSLQVNPDEAITRLLAALNAWLELRQPKREADTLYNLCRSYQLTSQLEQALAFGLLALERYRELDETLLTAVMAHQLGKIRQRLGDVARSVLDFEEALTLFRSLGSDREAGLALAQLGNSHHRLGDLRRSLESFDGAIALLEQSSASDQERADVLLNLGSVFLALNRPTEAQIQFDRAENIYRRHGDTLASARAIFRSANVAFRLGDSARANGLVEEALRILSAGDHLTDPEIAHNLAVAQLLSGRIQVQRQHLDLAASAFDAVLQIARRINDRQLEGTALLELGRHRFLRRDHEAALRKLDQALAIFIKIGDRAGEAMARVRGAEALGSLGRHLEAWRRVAPALEVTEDLRMASDRSDVRSDYFAFRQDFFEVAIDALLDLHAMAPDNGYQIQALEAHERRRARVLLDTLAEHSAPTRRQADPALLIRERRLEQQLREQTLAGAAESDSGIPALLDSLQEVRAEIRRSTRTASAPTGATPQRFQQIRDVALEENTLYLVYSLGRECSHLWAVTTDGVAVHELPERERIEALARRFAEHLQSRSTLSRKTRDRLALQLSELLLAPVAAELGESRLVIAPMGELQLIPFAALPEPDTGDAKDYLIRRHDIVTIASLSTLVQLRNQSRRRVTESSSPDLGIAAFGDPVFGVEDPRVRAATHAVPPPSTTPHPISGSALDSQRAFERFVGVFGSDVHDRLVYSRAEVDAILALSSDPHLRAVDFEANRATFFDHRLHRYRVLHFATHAFQDPGHPELSGLVLSLVGETGQLQDGFLRVFEISRLRLPADLVVLSACQTGSGKRIAGEGVFGLTRAFMDAGATAVVSSLWKIADRSTAQLMVDFYQAYLGQEMEPASALRQAQLAMLTEPETAEPYHWAAFVFQGEWKRAR